MWRRQRGSRISREERIGRPVISPPPSISKDREKNCDRESAGAVAIRGRMQPGIAVEQGYTLAGDLQAGKVEDDWTWSESIASNA